MPSININSLSNAPLIRYICSMYPLRLIVTSLFIIFPLLSFPQTENSPTDKQIKLAMRMIGNEFLLLIGDSTSRVLPVVKENNRYGIHFERKMSFYPDDLMFSALKVMEKSKISNNYIVEIEKDDTKEIVHSFGQTISIEGEALPCKGRKLPEDMYSFYLSILPPTIPLLEFVNDPKLVSSVNQKACNTKLILGISLGLGLLTLVGLFYYRSKKATPLLQSEHLIQIGDYHFDHRNMSLSIEGKNYSLTAKESELLQLLYTSVNETIERDIILREIWKDDGDYIGRSLDVFISKLRKKLQEDEKVKIINIRGVGYKLVLNH